MAQRHPRLLDSSPEGWKNCSTAAAETGAARWLSDMGDRVHYAALLLVGLWILIYPGVRSPLDEHRIEGDSVFYFAYLQSFFEDADLRFADDYLELNPAIEPAHLQTLPTGHTGNMFAPGAALCWTPFYLVAKGWLAIFAPASRASELGTLIAAVRMGTRFYAVLALLLIFSTLRRFYGPNTAWLGSLAAFFCTPFYVYGLFDTINAHAVSAFAVALFLWLALRSGSARGLGTWAELGLAAGLVTLCRWEDSVVLLWLVAEQAPRWIPAIRRRASLVPFLSCYGAAAGSFLLVLSPQLVLWWLLYGPWQTPLSAGSNRLIWSHPEITNVLFSSRHGLFSWHPLTYLALVGLLLLGRRQPRLAASALLTFSALLYLNAIIGDWWAGDAFGMRRFVSLAGLFGLGTAELAYATAQRCGWWRWLPGTALVLLAAWNIRIAGDYLRGVIPPDRQIGAPEKVARPLGPWISQPWFLFSWPGNLIHSLRTGGAPFADADWIASTYLFHLQNNLGGELLAAYPSFQDGFSRAFPRPAGTFRILGGTHGRIYVSHHLELSRTYLVLDARVAKRRMGADQVAVLLVSLNGERCRPVSGISPRLVDWLPTFTRGPQWRAGINVIDLELRVGSRDCQRFYRRARSGWPPGCSLQPNDQHYWLKLYRLKFHPGPVMRNG
jgi:hypothetical protein